MLMASIRVSRSVKLGLGFWWRRWISTTSSSDGKLSTTRSNNRFVAALWGNGDDGRLGLGSLESKWRPAFCSSASFDNENLRGIACGGAHTLFLTDTGRVFATGLNDYGQLGISDNRSYTPEPLEVSGLPREIVKIAAGYDHSSAITVNGELYMWGNNSSGELGLGKKAANVVPFPSKVVCLNGVPIKVVASGREHSIAITENGEALSWGGGGSGKLGHGHKPSILGFVRCTSEYTPRLIKKLEGVKIKCVAAGMLHSACIDENGSVYVFGAKTVWELGVGDANLVSTPSMISELTCSEVIACGAYHSCVITSGGELYTWGTNENGCLGTGCTDVAHAPERVQGPFLRDSVCEVSCGWKHTAAISGGNVYTWGWGGSPGTFSEEGLSSGGQLGLGNSYDHHEPTQVDFGVKVKAVQISCGLNHTGAILEYD